jgi:peptidoglycan/xylan/chitin deacetylase (PgdA/CDA1 family)
VRVDLLDVARRTWARLNRPRVLRERQAVGTLSMCFDDFSKTAWTEGGRVLRDHGVRGTYYMCGALAGSTFDGQQMFDGRDLELIHGEGHEIGCHTFDHRSCLRASSAEFERATLENQRFLSKHLGEIRLVSFAYPYGDTTSSAKRFAVKRFSSARGIHVGLNKGRLDLGQLNAVGFEMRKMQEIVIEEYIARAAALRAWLVVYTHDVQDHPSPYGCRPEDLDRLLRVAQAAGLEVLPVKAALAKRAFAATTSGS